METRENIASEVGNLCCLFVFKRSTFYHLTIKYYILASTVYTTAKQHVIKVKTYYTQSTSIAYSMKHNVIKVLKHKPQSIGFSVVVVSYLK